MTSLVDYRGYGEELERRARPKTFRIAVKQLEREEDIPEGAQRPKRDFGYHLSLCQSYQLSRRDGLSIVMLKEDNRCFEPGDLLRKFAEEWKRLGCEYAVAVEVIQI